MLKNKMRLLSGLALAICCVQSAQAAVYDQGQWNVAPHVGFAPSTFSKPFTVNTIVSDDGALPPQAQQEELNADAVISRLGSANYNKAYKMPFLVGFDLGYFLCPNLELFFGYQHMYAKSKTFLVSSDVLAGVTYTFNAKLRNYQDSMNYVGMRRFFDVDTCFVPFVGAKVGAVHHRKSTLTLTLANGVKIGGNSQFLMPGYYGSLGFVAGPQIGCDYRLTNCTALFMSVEALYRSGHSARGCTYVFENAGGAGVPKFSARITKAGSKSMAYPVAFGLRIRL